MPAYTDAELRETVRDLILNDDELIRRLRNAVEPQSAAQASIERPPGKMNEDYRINKWGYACIFGLIGLMSASDPGGLSEAQGFALGFFLTYLTLSLLELAAQRRLGNKGL